MPAPLSIPPTETSKCRRLPRGCPSVFGPPQGEIPEVRAICRSLASAAGRPLVQRTEVPGCGAWRKRIGGRLRHSPPQQTLVTKGDSPLASTAFSPSSGTRSVRCRTHPESSRRRHRLRCANGRQASGGICVALDTCGGVRRAPWIGVYAMKSNAAILAHIGRAPRRRIQERPPQSCSGLPGRDRCDGQRRRARPSPIAIMFDSAQTGRGPGAIRCTTARRIFVCAAAA